MNLCFSDRFASGAAGSGACGQNSQTVSSWAVKMAAAPLLTSAACIQVFLARLQIRGISLLLAISTRNRLGPPAPLPALHAWADLPWANSGGGSWGLVLTYCHAQIHWPKMVRAPQRGHVWIKVWMSTLRASLNANIPFRSAIIKNSKDFTKFCDYLQ